MNPDTTPMAYLRTVGPAGDPATRLGQGLAIVSIAVLAIVTALLLAAILRRRACAMDPRALAVSRDEGGVAWIYVGVGVSTLVLTACAVWTMATVSAMTQPVRTGLTLRVTASQWWWNVRYDDPVAGLIFDAPNEIHIPVGQPVRVELASDDVIHSFWIPRLAGKMDIIPGQTNVTWLQADAPGIYRGQCGEYCGVQHAHMALEVVAQSPDEFTAWADRQREPVAATVPDGLRHGRQTFVNACGACHTVRGSGAGGILGPDLTHLKSRRMLAAGLLPNTVGSLQAWIADAQALKPGTRMPRIALSGTDLAAVVAWLQTLE